MRIIESIAIAIATFVLAGIVVAIVAETPLAAHLTGPQGLIVWIAAQTGIVAVLLSIVPRRPITYVQLDDVARTEPPAH